MWRTCIGTNASYDDGRDQICREGGGGVRGGWVTDLTAGGEGAASAGTHLLVPSTCQEQRH